MCIRDRRNTVAPVAIIERFGADTARWFVLSDSPPERDMEWTEAGVAAAARFLQRLFRVVRTVAEQTSADTTCPETLSRAADSLRRTTHRTIVAVTDALEAFSANVAVARLHELTSALADAEKTAGEDGMAFARREAASVISLLIAPMVPHQAEAMMALLEPAGKPVVERTWPTAIPELLKASELTIAVQIMGKLRGTIAVPPDMPADEVIALAQAEPNVARLLEGARIVKRIHVPGRIVNFVVAK